MSKVIIFSIFFNSLYLMSAGQLTSCIQHWSKNNNHNKQIDSIISRLNFDNSGNPYTVSCDSFTVNSPFNPKWYINFYNNQFGKYFSNATSVNFFMFHFMRKTDSLSGEMHVTQFEFNKKDIGLIKSKFGKQSGGYKNYQLKSPAAYKYIVKNNSIYFISTNSFFLIQQNNSLFENVFNEFVKYK